MGKFSHNLLYLQINTLFLIKIIKLCLADAKRIKRQVRRGHALAPIVLRQLKPLLMVK